MTERQQPGLSTDSGSGYRRSGGGSSNNSGGRKRPGGASSGGGTAKMLGTNLIMVVLILETPIPLQITRLRIQS